MPQANSAQKFLTEREVVDLTGICLEHLRGIARQKQIGTIACACIAGKRAESWLFTASDLTILSALQPRCAH